MKKNKFNHAILTVVLTIGLLAAPVPAQRGGGIRTDTRITYHNGPVMPGTSSVYLIWYGNWSNDPGVVSILSELAGATSGTPYFLINTTYTGANGDGPSGGTLFAGSVSDVYSHGPTLTVDDIKEVVVDQIASFALPLDPAGIYIVVASSDVTDIRPDGSMFCTPGTPPQHGVTVFEGTSVKYGFLGGADRCPTSAGPQFIAPDGSLLPTPNGDFAADAMASTYMRLLNVIVTNPTGYGWYDRYGLENADKCVGKFGSTYMTANGATANIQLGGRDFLIQQNWINDRKGRCTMSIAQ